jgi:hypothetical protein
MAEMTQGERDHLTLLCGYLRGMSESGRHGFDAHERAMLAAGSSLLGRVLGEPDFEMDGPVDPLPGIIARAAEALAPVGLIELIDAYAFLASHGRPTMAHAFDRASAAIAEAREILAEATAISPAWLDRARAIPPPSFD